MNCSILRGNPPTWLEIQKTPCNLTYIDLINKIRIKPRPRIVPVKSTGNYILLGLGGLWAMSTVHLNRPSPYLALMFKAACYITLELLLTRLCWHKWNVLMFCISILAIFLARCNFLFLGMRILGLLMRKAHTWRSWYRLFCILLHMSSVHWNKDPSNFQGTEWHVMKINFYLPRTFSQSPKFCGFTSCCQYQFDQSLDYIGYLHF